MGCLSWHQNFWWAPSPLLLRKTERVREREREREREKERKKERKKSDHEKLFIDFIGKSQSIYQFI